MSLHAIEAEQAMGARIIPFFEKVTETFSYLVMDLPTQAAAIIDSVLDYDPAAGRIGTHSADAIAKMVHAEGLRVEWILETHVHADHLSAAGYLKKKLGGVLGIGSNVRRVQQILGNLFDDKPVIPPGAGFDHLFEDGESFRVGTLDLKALYTPGHTPADMSYMLEDAVFAGDTLFMPDYGTARCDFPGGDARTLSLFAVFEPANMFLAVELDAELLDELQLRFQKIDVLFLIDEQLVIELLGNEVVGGNAIFRRLGVERSRGNLGVEVTAKNFIHRLSDPQRVEDLEVRESFQKKNASG